LNAHRKSLEKLEIKSTNMKDSNVKVTEGVIWTPELEKEWDIFQEWFIRGEGYHIAEKIYGKQASLNADKIDPNLEMNGVYSDLLEKYAWKNKLHKK